MRIIVARNTWEWINPFLESDRWDRREPGELIMRVASRSDDDRTCDDDRKTSGPVDLTKDVHRR